MGRLGGRGMEGFDGWAWEGMGVGGALCVLAGMLMGDVTPHPSPTPRAQMRQRTCRVAQPAEHVRHPPRRRKAVSAARRRDLALEGSAEVVPPRLSRFGRRVELVQVVEDLDFCAGSPIESGVTVDGQLV